jgi:polyisoprenoid-binding protein YceI
MASSDATRKRELLDEVLMSAQLFVRSLAVLSLTVLSGARTTAVVTAQAAHRSPVAIESARISITGTTNVHDYSASTTQVRITRFELAKQVTGPNAWDELLKPGGLTALDIAVPAATLASPKGDLDKNMHKALDVKSHPDIVFRLRVLEALTSSTVKAIGSLRIAGVEKDVVLNLETRRVNNSLAVKGELQLLMTDYGITPPKAMLGMLKTDPKVSISFDAVFGPPAA